MCDFIFGLTSYKFASSMKKYFAVQCLFFWFKHFLLVFHCRSAGPTLIIDIQRSKAYEILDTPSWQQVLPPNSSLEQMELRRGQDDNSGEFSDDSKGTDNSVDEGIFSLPSHLITSTPLPLFMNGHQVG